MLLGVGLGVGLGALLFSEAARKRVQTWLFGAPTESRESESAGVIEEERPRAVPSTEHHAEATPPH